MMTLLVLLLCLYAPFRLAMDPPPWSLPWVHGVARWLRGHGGKTCPHLSTTVACDPAPAGMITATTVCQTCQAILLTRCDTEARWTEAHRREVHREPLRLFLHRWFLVPVHEYVRFCPFIGVLTVTLALVLWLTWGWIGGSLVEGCGPHVLLNALQASQGAW